MLQNMKLTVYVKHCKLDWVALCNKKTIPMLTPPYWVNLSKRGGKNGVFQGLLGLGKLGNPLEQPCQPSKNPVVPDSFTQIYILFLISFRIGPPKMH